MKRLRPELRFFGCAGPRMIDAGVRPVVHSSSLSVVGLAEVVSHIPRIWGEFRKLIAEAERERPALAILTDSPDFNLRVATRLRKFGVPVIYLVAPQVWAWREGRIRRMRRDIRHLLCIFPFEEAWFRERGVPASYIGHPLTRVVRPSLSREEFFGRHHLEPGKPVVAMLPGSRVGEVARHLPIVLDCATLLRQSHQAQALLAAPSDFRARAGEAFFRERIPPGAIQVIEGETWDALAHADVSVAASGTVTVEAALLGAPMVTFYRVTPLSWLLGRRLVRAPFLTMVNLIAGRRIVPELMQDEATGERLARQTAVLLDEPAVRNEMKRDIALVSSLLATGQDPMERAARLALEHLH